MIREPNGTTDMFTQNKQPWRNHGGRLSMEEPRLETESEQRSGEENKLTGQIVDRKRRQKSML